MASLLIGHLKKSLTPISISSCTKQDLIDAGDIDPLLWIVEACLPAQGYGSPCRGRNERYDGVMYTLNIAYQNICPKYLLERPHEKLYTIESTSMELPALHKRRKLEENFQQLATSIKHRSNIFSPA